MAFLSEKQLSELGLKSIGTNVLISDKCSIYGKNITIGNNVRIDDFCILSGHINIGSNIHIGAYSALYGGHCITMEDYTGLSPRCTIFSMSDNFNGNFLISPMNPTRYCCVVGGLVLLKKFVQIGAGSVIMPHVTIDEGAAIGAMSFVKKDVPRWQIWAGSPLNLLRTEKEV